MKKIILILILPLVLAGALVFANREIKNEAKLTSLPIVGKKAPLNERKKWEASPDGVNYKKWEASAEGKKVHASHEKIKKDIKAFADMEAIVTSVTFERENAKPSGPKWLIVSINSETYMMQFSPKDFMQLNHLKVDDKIIIRSRSAGYSHNHPYLILSCDYISQNNKILLKRDISKNNRC